MFTVYDRKTFKKANVYHVDKNLINDYPVFLVRHNGSWIWRNAEYYIDENEVKEKLKEQCTQICTSCNHRELCEELRCMYYLDNN